MAGYKYKGAHVGPDMFDATDPRQLAKDKAAERLAAKDEQPKKEPQTLRPCGTRAAYNRHLAHKEKPCEPCKAAETLHGIRRRQRKHPQPCGTNAAYHRHNRAQEPPCDPCKKAHADHMAEHRGGRAGQNESECGTRSGYHRHIRDGQIPCPECRQANTEYHREHRARMIGQQQAA